MRQANKDGGGLQGIEQYRLQMAAISTAAIGYWKEGDDIHPDYMTPALLDVARLYAKYDALYQDGHAATTPQAEAQAGETASLRKEAIEHVITLLMAAQRAVGGPYTLDVARTVAEEFVDRLVLRDWLRAANDLRAQLAAQPQAVEKAATPSADEYARENCLAVTCEWKLGWNDCRRYIEARALRNKAGKEGCDADG